MSEEPTYRFVRGQGWIPGIYTHDYITRTLGHIQVTVEMRNPEPGERYYIISDTETCEMIIGYMENDFNDGYLDANNPPGALNDETDTPLSSWGVGVTRFCVVKVVAL
jgi:hypothetical protein